MKPPAEPTMEDEIMSEENLQAQQVENIKEHPPKNLNIMGFFEKLKTIKIPKLKYIILATAALIICLIALVVVSSQNTKKPDVVPDIVITSPKASTTKSPEVKQLEAELDKYDQKVNSLQTTIEDYQPPKVDLDLKF